MEAGSKSVGGKSRKQRQHPRFWIKVRKMHAPTAHDTPSSLYTTPPPTWSPSNILVPLAGTSIASDLWFVCLSRFFLLPFTGRPGTTSISLLHCSHPPPAISTYHHHNTYRIMRLSCNGCRVLRKGCSDACTIRPCLQWIKSPDAQANATVFLAKFYGRAGLLNLVAAAPNDALRPAVFRSLLYEACGRIVNPVYGAVGLLWSGSWHMCQAAVEAVLNGAPIVQVSRDDAAAPSGPPITINAASASAPPAAYDIRHVFPKSNSSSAAQSKDDKRTSSSPLSKTTKKSKTTIQNKQPHLAADASPATEQDDDMLVADHSDEAAVRPATNSNGKTVSRRASSDDRHSASASLDTDEVASSHVSQATQQDDRQAEAEAEAEQRPPPSVGLDLTLGLLTSSSAPSPAGGCIQGGSRGSSAAAVNETEPAGVIGFRFL